mgnify:CR=1 FL=1
MTRDKSLVLCDNCANALEKKLRRDIEDARKILRMYEKYDSDKIMDSNTTVVQKTISISFIHQERRVFQKA